MAGRARPGAGVHQRRRREHPAEAYRAVELDRDEGGGDGLDGRTDSAGGLLRGAGVGLPRQEAEA